MISFRKSDSNSCLVCGEDNVKIFDMGINRPFRNNENIITFAICGNCLLEFIKKIELQLEENYDTRR